MALFRILKDKNGLFIAHAAGYGQPGIHEEKG